MAADKGKKQKVEEKEEDPKPIDEKTLVFLEKLQGFQDELDKVNEQAVDEILVVEQKYNEIRKPLYKERNELIKSIPDFWLTSFLNHPVLRALLTEDDQKILKYLTSLEVEDNQDIKSGYSITFNFASNPYFEDAKLVKTISQSQEGMLTMTGTKINWKEGSDITKGVSHSENGKKRPFPEESFFCWFGATSEPDISGVFDEMAEVIKEDLWRDPVKYFNNEIELVETDDDDDDDDDEDDEDDDEDEDDEDNEDGDDEN